MNATRQHAPIAATARGAGAQVVCTMPAFLMGAMAVQLTRDLAFGAAALGAAVGLYHLAGAVASPWLGRLVDRMGATWSLQIATGLGVVVSAGIAFIARSWWMLVGFLILGGTSRALAQPAANRLLVNRVRSERLGFAFGVKQSAPPIASMLAGLSVPAVALTLGWRWAYAFTALFGLLVVITIGRARMRPMDVRRGVGASVPLRDRGTLFVLGGAMTLTFFANSSALTFYVESSVRAGTPEHVAGLVLAAASLGAIGTRLVAGWTCDRSSVAPLSIAGALLVVGTLGTALMIIGAPAAMALGVVLTLIGTWGFQGLYWLELMRAYPDNPGRVTGAVAPASIGGVLGPMAFGVIASTIGYRAGWTATFIAALLGAVAMAVGQSRLARAGRKSSEGSPPLSGGGRAQA